MADQRESFFLVSYGWWWWWIRIWWLLMDDDEILWVKCGMSKERNVPHAKLGEDVRIYIGAEKGSAFTTILEQDLFYSSYPLCEQSHCSDNALLLGRWSGGSWARARMPFPHSLPLVERDGWLMTVLQCDPDHLQWRLMSDLTSPPFYNYYSL